MKKYPPRGSLRRITIKGLYVELLRFYEVIKEHYKMQFCPNLIAPSQEELKLRFKD